MIWKISKHSFCIQLAWLVSLALFADTTFSNQRGLNQPRVIEVFTSAKYPIIETVAKGDGNNLQGLEITVYEIDGIHSVERDLSFNLPVDPQQSKRLALQRIQSLDEQSRLRMQIAATALSKAMQYGVDRFPAIVFDGQVVAYGVTDLQVALTHYQAYMTGSQP
jgi:integrating conjugative element protein (TIGR03757 family)